MKPFDPKKKIIEYILENDQQQLIDLNLKQFSEETASESPAPGGGSIAAYMGAMGAALGTMVANLSAHKRGWDNRWSEFSTWAEKGKVYHDQLLKLVDEDTRAFNAIMDAFSLPKSSEEEKATRKFAIDIATKYAIEVPFKVMELCYQSMEVMKAMSEIGNPNSVTDAGVGVLAARAGVQGAFLNVKVNAKGFSDQLFVKEIFAKCFEMEEAALKMERSILKIVDDKIS
ncbi:MAG: cyclodeaminase/cyclohydrolase family protein [Prolixibacteraceae bacterium]|nr:cyclodeaminase/cyclohydrolase family protein [Prolixibacteraceae bacterium]